MVSADPRYILLYNSRLRYRRVYTLQANSYETYSSRKKLYGFNLQAISNWSGRFIYVATGYTVSIHDSTAFKNCPLYREMPAYV